MAARKYSEAQIEAAVALRERGLTYSQIARKTGMSKSAVDWYCLKLGAEPPHLAPPPRNVGMMIVQRGGHLVRRFTDAEDAILLRMEAEGHRLSDIARQVGRRRNSVLGRLMTLARRDARQEELSA